MCQVGYNTESCHFDYGNMFVGPYMTTGPCERTPLHSVSVLQQTGCAWAFIFRVISSALVLERDEWTSHSIKEIEFFVHLYNNITSMLKASSALARRQLAAKSDRLLTGRPFSFIHRTLPISMGIAYLNRHLYCSAIFPRVPGAPLVIWSRTWTPTTFVGWQYRHLSFNAQYSLMTSS